MVSKQKYHRKLSRLPDWLPDHFSFNSPENFLRASSTGELNTGGVWNSSRFSANKRMCRKRCKIWPKLYSVERYYEFSAHDLSNYTGRPTWPPSRPTSRPNFLSYFSHWKLLYRVNISIKCCISHLLWTHKNVRNCFLYYDRPNDSPVVAWKPLTTVGLALCRWTASFLKCFNYQYNHAIDLF